MTLDVTSNETKGRAARDSSISLGFTEAPGDWVRGHVNRTVFWLVLASSMACVDIPIGHDKTNRRHGLGLDHVTSLVFLL